MQELKEALRAYLRGHTDLAPVRAALDAAVRQLPADERPKVYRLLEAARGHGLADDAHAGLASQARDIEQSLAPAPDEVNPDLLSTVVLPAGAPRAPAPTPAPSDDGGGDGEFLETVVLPGGASGRKRGQDPAPADDEATVFTDSGRADPDATMFPSDAPEAGGDPDATVFAGDGPGRGGGPPAADPDATVFAGDDDDERTRIVEPGTSAGRGVATPPPPSRDGAESPGSAAGDDDERTRIVDYSERTDLGAVPSPATRGGDVDRTDIGAGGADDDATEINATSSGTHDPDATVFARDEDATEIGGGERDGFDPAASGRESDEDVTAVNLQADDEDVTAVNERADDGDVTAVNRQAADEDATAVNAVQDATTDDGDATAMGVAGDSDRTEVVADAGGDAFDIFAPENLAAADTARERSGGSWPTGAPPPPPGAAGLGRDFGAGDRIRDRFELISKLGEGGMGAVWKAKDLLKEEARDRNPYVAMKLLQGDFKNHPEAFIALQRETAKQQRLAHPNIATVYDFDRDAATGTVFMTMEVMEGQPMDSFIRKLPADGLPAEEAMPLIEQLCRGLQYAHDAGLVHSDLKPGNCFLTKENTVKLLDFGIARASKTKSDAEGETTLFDPGQLGALTPTYATIEMFEGQDPDPRDDIYALAIISYQLLTGKHPYGKKSAPKARDLKLEPEPIAKLNKAQNKALRRGLAFLRDERTGSVSEFLEGITPRKSRTGMFVGLGLAATVLIAVLAYGPIVGELDRREREEVIAVIQNGDLGSLQAGLEQVQALPDPDQREAIVDDQRVIDAVVAHITRGDAQSIAEGRALLEPFPDSLRRTVMQDARTRQAIIEFYETQRLAAANPSEGRYDFPAALEAIDRLKSIYPDSATVYRIETELLTERDTLLNELGNRYNDLLAAGMLIPDPAQDDIGDVLDLVRTIDPDNRLLTDESLRFEFESRVERAMAEQDYTTAKQYLDASLAYAAGDPTLANLRYQVETELQRIADQQLVAEIQQRLRAEYPTFSSLADFQRVRDDLIKLADLDPTNPVLTEIQNSLKDAFGRELQARIRAAEWMDAEQLLLDYAKLLDIPYVTDRRAQLSAAEASAGFQVEVTPARQAAIDERIETLQALIADPQFTSDWEIAFRVPYKELIALLPLGDPALEPVRNATAQLYLDRASAAREAGRFAEALAYVDHGRTFYPGLDAFDTEQEAVAAAQEVLRKQREEQERLARLERRKGDLMTAAKADDVDRAKQILEELRAGLPADDEFVADEAPRAIAQSYMNLARLQADDRQFDNAATFTRLGLELRPGNSELQEMLGTYEAEVAKRAEQIAVGKLFEGSSPLDAGALQPRLANVRAQFSDDWNDIARGYARARLDGLAGVQVASAGDLARVTDRMSELKSLLPQAFEELQKPFSDLLVKNAAKVAPKSVDAVNAVGGAMRDARQLFPSRAPAIADALGENVRSRIKTLERSDRNAANQMLAAARTVLPDSDVISRTSVVGPDPRIEQGLEQVATGELSAAYGAYQLAQREDPDHPDLPGFKQALDARLGKAQDYYGQFVQLIQARRKTEACGMLARAMTEWTDSPDFEKRNTQYCGTTQTTVAGQCSAKLAGHGAKSRAACWDSLDGDARGPTLVVVPAGGGSAQPFAIGKYEVSVSDYNTYCRLSGSCQPVGGGDDSLPVTGISVQQAEAYAQWLSEKTGASYRLPTAGEWEFAANAGGQLPSQSEFNCRVESSGTVIKGLSLVDAQSGKPNGWGLINFIGNAQEWVRSGGGFAARGGAFDDPLTRCGVSLNKPHSGNADAVTSFRLVRELG